VFLTLALSSRCRGKQSRKPARHAVSYPEDDVDTMMGHWLATHDGNRVAHEGRCFNGSRLGDAHEGTNRPHRSAGAEIRPGLYVWRNQGDTAEEVLERHYLTSPSDRFAGQTYIFSWLES
jgi:hypothetical protein